MNITVQKLPRDSTQPDIILLFTIILLSGIGLAVLFSASYYRADLLFGDPFRFVRNQAVYTAIGMVLILLATFFPLRLLNRFIPIILVTSLILMVLTLIPGIGVEYFGARRQIQIGGYTFQPTELVKISLILYLAHILGKKQESLNDLINTLLPPILVVVIFLGLIYLQNDFSSAMFIGLICLSMFFVAGVRRRYFIAFAIVVIPLSLILLLSREHRVIRVISFLEPDLDPSGAGYQVLSSLTALRNGGLWGQGIGRSLQKLGGLPEAQSDFIFAVLGEEFGFMGVLGILALFVILAWRGYRNALRQQSPFRCLLAYGITSILTVQAGINMAVISGIAPATGIPMPFLAAGGSHLLVSMVFCGLLLNISRSTSDESQNLDSLEYNDA